MKENSQYLILFSTGNNNNKFYYAELMDDNNTVLVKYGRVGNDGVTHTYYGGINKYNNLLRVKRNKGYKDAMIEATVDDNGVSITENVIDTALNEIKYKDDMAKELVTTISKKNVHKITNATSITFDAKDGLFKTPLGVIKRQAVEEAMGVLKKIEDLLPIYLDLKDPKSASKKGTKRGPNGEIQKKRAKPLKTLESIKQEMLDLNDEYFSLIPNKVKNARDISNLLFTQTQIDEQRSTCDALIETLDLIQDLKDSKKDDAKVEKKTAFDIEIKSVTNKKKIDEISKLYDSTKNGSWSWLSTTTSVKNVYEIKLGSQQKPFKERSKEIGGVQQLWHGTRTQNMLSIMSKGLLLPKLSPGQKCGAAFGDGIYFANESSKSLGFCDYGWCGSGKETIYMFLASVAMGNHYTPKTCVSKPPPKGYHSYWANKEQTKLGQDELIVFSADQVRLDYILEIESTRL